MPATKDSSGRVLETVSIQTHGCKLNAADTEVLARRLTQAGYLVVGPSQPADICIVNTCTVTHVADRKARQALRAAHRRNPDALVVATGCYVQRAREELGSVEGVGLVAGNTDKDRLVDMIVAARRDVADSDSTAGDGSPSAAGESLGRTRAMVKIQEGCDQVCAYCIVPRVRGRERSIPPDILLSEVRDRVHQGYKEVVLTGTQLGSYGFDLEHADLTGLVALLLEESGIERLRVSSLQPQEIGDDLLDLWGDPRLCPHFHMPLQSGSDPVLKRMRRRYTAAQYARTAERVRERVPGVAITADVIVGFPGETEDQFRDSQRFAQDMEFAAMHVFPYSVRPGTSAAFMGPPVDHRTKRERMDRMLDLARQQAAAYRGRSLGTVRPVLWESTGVRDGKRAHLGLTDSYLRVFTRQPGPLLNRILPARLVADVDGLVQAEVLQGALARPA